ncbi:MFS transporter [Microbacterium hominis]|uniref:MFS transporter n=1 Tax=Microbacterium hominis TaxID=162426 RepID=A0A7D4UGF8_9MICO|nr:MFS transporter [Microbacterium hominis]QKJ19589.1 MFS transporter [Microbacterium hominis]
MNAPVERPASVWGGSYLWVTVGAVALIFLAATQALAITTVMPVVSDDLDGAALYAAAFSGTLAASVIGMVVVGAWCDRGDVLAPLTTAVVLFVVGLVIAGLATSMPVLVAGRLVQGLGTGGQTVALYVVVARVYPGALHGRVFAVFSAAWVVPSLVGPALAGAVAELVGWRWVFLGVAILAVAAFALVAARLRGRHLAPDEPSHAPLARRLVCAVAVAAGALGVTLAGELDRFAGVAVVASLVLIIVSVRPLLPPGTLRLGRGLPSVVTMRGLISGALFGAEIYVPYLLIDEYGFSPVWAGAGLTAGAVAWAAASEVQGRYSDRIGTRRIAVIGVALLAGAIAAATVTAWWALWPGVIVAGWAAAGAGMGLMYPRLTVLTLAYSTPQNQGFNSAALSIAENVGAAMSIALLGLVFTALAGTGAAFATVFALATGLALLALVPGVRLGSPQFSDLPSRQ